MIQEQKDKILEMLAIQGEMREQAMSENLLTYLLKRLEPFGYEKVMNALERLGMECQYKINLAEIIKRIDDGRPEPQLAWTQCPKSEQESGYLTTEQNQAYCEVSAQYESGDKIGARMAFLERYSQLVKENQSMAKPVEYFFSRGFDLNGRKDVISKAVESGKLLKQKACHLLGYQFDKEIMALEAPTEPAIMIEDNSDPIGLDKLAESMKMPL